MTKIALCLALASLAAAAAPASAIQFQSTEQQVSLLELYTSEGCSSCPPAESWLGRLKESPELWRSFAPMALHVDYWNSLGWKDRWSSPDFSERQRAYAETWKSDNIYTPCFVLNGKEWRGWFGGKDVPTTGEKVGALAVNSANTNIWTAIFIPSQPASLTYEIHAALLGGGLNSEVKAGENSGRHLQHEFTVLALAQMNLATSKASAKGKFILDLPPDRNGMDLAITVWVTSAGRLEPLQATGGWLCHPTGGRSSSSY